MSIQDIVIQVQQKQTCKNNKRMDFKREDRKQENGFAYSKYIDDNKRSQVLQLNQQLRNLHQLCPSKHYN